MVAVVGSRTWPEPERVRALVRALAQRHPGAVVVSGGAENVDRTAERVARESGLGVISYRVEKRIVWRLEWLPRGRVVCRGTGPGPRNVLVEHPGGRRVVYSWRGPGAIRTRVEPQPMFARAGQALLWRNGLIVRDAERVVAFHVGEPWLRYEIVGTRGTRDAIEKALTLGRPVYRYLPGVRAPEVYDETAFLAEALRLTDGRHGA